MVCIIKSLVNVQGGVEGGQVVTLGFQIEGVVNFRIVSELRGIKFELKMKEITYYHAMKFWLDVASFLHRPVFAYTSNQKLDNGKGTSNFLQILNYVYNYNYFI